MSQELTLKQVLTPQQFVDKLREEFDGGDRFIYRVFVERDKSYTVEEFYQLPAQEGHMAFVGTILVCRDGFGWGLTQRGEIYGFPCPWNVPGPGEHIEEP